MKLKKNKNYYIIKNEQILPVKYIGKKEKTLFNLFGEEEIVVRHVFADKFGEENTSKYVFENEKEATLELRLSKLEDKLNNITISYE